MLAVACDKKKEEPTPKPQPATPEIKVPTESQAIFSSGMNMTAGTSAQSQTVKFTTTAAWSADVADTKASSWLSVQPSSGSAGTVNMTVTAQPNAGAEDREASVTIKCGTVTQKFTVKQAGVPIVEGTEVTLDKAELGLVEGQEAELKATVKPDNATDKSIIWTTTNASVATVTDGLVTAVGEGTAIIQASAGDKAARCEVTVTAYQISVSPASLSFLNTGGSKEVKVTCNGDWSLSGQPSWCTPSITSGTGNATIQLTVSANNDARRTGYLTFTCSGITKSVPISQLGGGWQNRRFVHKSLYMMFTSVYCGYSIIMDDRIRQADKLIGDKYHRVDVYENSLGDNDLNFDEADYLKTLYYYTTPCGVIDYRISLGNTPSTQETFVSAIRQQEELYPAVTGVSFKATIEGNILSVSGRVYSHVADAFKLTVFLIENQVEEDLRLFDNVLRKSLTSVKGDDFTIDTKNTTQEFRYNVPMPEEYNKNNLYLLVIVSRPYGQQEIVRTISSSDYYVDNCRLAKVGEDAKLLLQDITSGGGNEGYEEGEEITL